MPRVVPTQIVAFIDEHFTFARIEERFNVDLQFKDRVSALLRLVDEMPGDLIVMSPGEYNRFTLSSETLRSTIELWNAHGVTPDHVNARLGSAITNLRKCLAGLSDEQVPAATAGLAFIKDADLRDSIRADVAAAVQAFRDDEWKGATVLGGAVVEALLLWAINEQATAVVQTSFEKLKAGGKIGKKTDHDPDNWTLEIYKLVTADLGIIKGNTIKLIEIAQGFRNLIHPGKANRTKEQCSRSTAHAALAAMEKLIEEFS